MLYHNNGLQVKPVKKLLVDAIYAHELPGACEKYGLEAQAAAE